MTTEGGPDVTAAAAAEREATAAEPEVTAAAPAPERGRRKTRAAAKVAGVVGLVVCAVLAIGVLIAHGWISDAVGGVFETADRQIERGSTIVELASDRVQERVTDIDDFIANVSAITPGANIPPALAARAATVADRYDAVRNQFAELRARVESGLETVRQVARLVPFIELPTLPTEELAALDARLQQFDDSVGRLREAGVASVAVERVVEGATNLRGAIDQVADLGDRIQTRLDEAQQRLDQANSRLDGFLWILTLILLLLVGYIAILNGLVIWLARR
jgi:hypothetical protein